MFNDNLILLNGNDEIAARARAPETRTSNNKKGGNINFGGGV